MPIDTTIIKDLDSNSHAGPDITKTQAEESKQINQTDSIHKPIEASNALQAKENTPTDPVLYLGKYKEMLMDQCTGKEIQYIVKEIAKSTTIRSEFII
jgi:hypothetical protein